MKRLRTFWPILGLMICLTPLPVNACSCAWEGPFLAVAKKAPLVIRGRILRHHPGRAPTMDVLALDTLAGGLMDSGLAVQMGDGMHCRPMLEGFPPGSEWILALNGPGSKPGSGLALSHCGEYWLKIDQDMVVGSIDGAQNQSRQMPLQELKNCLLYPLFKSAFSGRVEAGKRFERPFGSRFLFVLEPAPAGWEIKIQEQERDENLAHLTPPLHFMPNPRDIEGWHLAARAAQCPGCPSPSPSETPPENPRLFIFSPAVGKTIAGPTAARSVTVEDMEAVRGFGRGTLSIDDFKLEWTADGSVKIKWMRFSVQIEGGCKPLSPKPAAP
jgi:hypothetical protein